MPASAVSVDTDLNQLKRQAKELLAQFRAGDPDAQRRIAAHVTPRPGEAIALHDCQHTIAREHGADRWAKLKARVETSTPQPPIEFVSPELLDRIEQFNGDFNFARFGALRDVPGNPYEIELRTFGSASAVKSRSPLLRNKQRVTGFATADAPFLAEILAWYHADGLRCTITMRPGQMNEELFRRFSAAGLWSRASSSPLVLLDSDRDRRPKPAGLTVRESPMEEREGYLDLMARCFVTGNEANPAYRQILWAEDSLPAGRRFIAELNGQPVGIASMPVVGGIALFATAATMPDYRGRGVQLALIRRRIAAAREAGCSAILASGTIGTTSGRNFERVGFRPVVIGMSWIDAGNASG